MDVISARAFLLQPRGGWLLGSAWHNNENSDTENMSIFHCAHSKGLEFSAICMDVTVDVITSRSRAICMDVSLDVNFRGPALPVGLQQTSELIFAAIHAKSFDSESDIQVQVRAWSFHFDFVSILTEIHIQK